MSIYSAVGATKDSKLTSVERQHLICIVLLALVLRVFVSVMTPVVGTDCYNFVHAAWSFSEGKYSEGLGHPFHPLFPFLIAVVSNFTGEYEAAGKAVALIFGTLTVFPLYFLARSMFGHNAAIFSVLFLAINPTHIRLSADIMSDVPHIFFFVTAVWMTWYTIKRQSWYCYAILGFIVVLDYATRVEGIGLVLIILPWLLLTNIGKTRKNIVRKLSYVFLFIFVIAVLATPYLLSLSKKSGVWLPTRQTALLIFLGEKKEKAPDLKTYRFRRGTDEKRKPEAVRLAGWKENRQYHMICIYIVREFIKGFYEPLLIFFVVGFFKVVRPKFMLTPLSLLGKSIIASIGSIRLRLASTDVRVELFLLSIFCLYFILFYRLAYSAYYISGRYVLPMVVLSFVWAGLGLELITSYLAGIFSSTKYHWLSSTRIVALLVIVIMAVSLPKGLKVKRKHEVSKKEAGHWIRSHFVGGRPVIMGDEKVAFYAQGEYLPLATENYKLILDKVKEFKINYLVFYKEDILREYPWIYRDVEASEEFSFLKEWVDKVGKKKKRLRVYRFNIN